MEKDNSYISNKIHGKELEKMGALQTTGFNADTAKNLLLDAGAVYKNFDKILS